MVIKEYVTETTYEYRLQSQMYTLPVLFRKFANPRSKYESSKISKFNQKITDGRKKGNKDQIRETENN